MVNFYEDSADDLRGCIGCFCKEKCFYLITSKGELFGSIDAFAAYKHLKESKEYEITIDRL